MKKTKITAAAAVSAGLVLAGCGDSGSDESEGVTLEFAHYYTQGEETVGEVRLIEQIEEGTDGSISINVHWAESLGGPRELPELTTSGAIDLGILSTHFIPDPYPFYRTAAMSVWVDDPMAALDVQQEVQERIFDTEPFLAEMEENNLVPLLHQPLPAYYFISNRDDCSLDGLRGQRVRSVGSDLPDMLQVAGATPVSLTTGEIYEALERGTVDSITIPMRHMLAYDLYEVGDYVCGPIFIFANGHTTVMNKDVWDDLSEEQQTSVQEAADEAQQWFTQDSKEREAGYREQLEAEGVTFLDFPAEDLQQWQSDSPDFITTWRESVGDADGADETEALLREITE